MIVGLDFEILDCISRAWEVISKGRAAQDVSKVGVSDILVWDAVVLVPTGRSSFTGSGALQGLRCCYSFVQVVWQGTHNPIQEFTDDLRHRLRAVWRDVEG
eukprot:515804-Pelagomonas_calceolata.AAC.1